MGGLGFNPPAGRKHVLCMRVCHRLNSSCANYFKVGGLERRSKEFARIIRGRVISGARKLLEARTSRYIRIMRLTFSYRHKQYQ